MNNRGQLQIIAAMLVAVILVGTVMITFSQLRNSSVQETPQILSATDEIQLAINQILCTTIRYYGSVLQVTGNSSYARNAAQVFLYNQTRNIPSMYPAWGISLNVTGISLRVNWFSNYSYSNGTLYMTYDLKGLGLSNISYNSSSSLVVQTNSGAATGQASLTINKDYGSPVTSLGTQNFRFYSYNYTNSTWNIVSPSTFQATFTNGTYIVNLPQGVDSNYYIVQVIDQRGLMAVASSSNLFVSGLNWNVSLTPIAHYVDNYATDVDLNGEMGSHSNFTAQQYGPDSTSDTLTETQVVNTQSNAYYPSNFISQGLTQNVSGSLANLQADDSNYMGFSSWPSATSAASLYSQQTTTSMGGSSYYTLGLGGASQAGVTLTADMSAVGRSLLGKLVYPLAGVNTINASTWTVNYRAWKTDPSSTITYDTSTSQTQSYSLNYISWTHTVASGSNGLLVVTISTYLSSYYGSPATCTGCTYNGIVMDQQVTDYYLGSPKVRSYIFTLTSPPAGSAYTIRANFSGSTVSVGGAVSYLNVNQTSPVQATNSDTGSGTSASVSVGVSGSGRAVYGSLAGYRTSYSWTISDPSGQNDRWTESSQLYKGDGDDKLNVSPGSVSTSWTMSSTVSYVALAIAINPCTATSSAVGHCDADILIRKSDGTVRTNVATGQAPSGLFTSSASTLSGTYAWSNYSVVAQTDYLEFDFYVNTTTASAGSTANLMIDNSSLTLAQQTRIDNVYLPSQYTSAVVFEGVSDSQSWTQLNWTINSQCSTSGVTVTCQLYNFNSGSYPASGNGYQTGTVGTTDVTQSQVISTNPSYYRNATNWFRIMVQCVKTTTTQFYWNCDLIQYLTNCTTTSYRLDLEEQWINANFSSGDQLAIYEAGSSAENLEVDFWNGTAWNTILPSLTSGWNNASIPSYMTSSFTIRFLDGNIAGDTIQNSWQIDATLVRTNFAGYAQLQDSTMALELLQNGTTFSLGQPLTTVTSKPIPPIPLKAFHVNQTINGVEQEVPFQIEDWASNYKVPLGLSSNASIFSNQNMIVYLVTPKVTAIKIWWNGSDDAIQTPLAYTNLYFTADTTQRIVTNGILNLQIDFTSGAFHVISTIGSSTSTAELFRINNDFSDYGHAEPNYAITNGPVRAVIHHEVEWGSNGIPNCYDTLAHLIITLPANATYYTYALRLMFLNTTTTRTITDLCPLKLSSSINTIQTENGTATGYPIVTSTTGLFYNMSQTIWAHHWTQFISGTKGTGIMFTDNDNQKLYAFDTPTTKTGALNTDPTADKIELLPVKISQINLPNAFDITWHGAVVTFDGTTPIYDPATKGGLWIMVEYPPSLT